MVYSSTPPPAFPTTPAAPLFPPPGFRQRGEGCISAVERSIRFVYEESIAAQCGHGNDALRCTRDGECDLEILVIRRMGNDGEPLAG